MGPTHVSISPRSSTGASLRGDEMAQPELSDSAPERQFVDEHTDSATNWEETSMSKPLSRRLRDFFTGFPNIYSASPDPGAPRD